MKFILASASPRRRELMEMLRVSPLEIRPAKGEEHPDPDLNGEETAAALSRQKCAEVARSADPEDVVIAADTVVWLEDTIFGKPHDHDDAVRMLSALSGRSHTVYTGVTIARGGEMLTEVEASDVRFRELTMEEIEAYIATGEPMDKAGAYGAQGYASLFVEGIDGDFFNVMGLPLCRLGQMLKAFGISLI